MMPQEAAEMLERIAIGDEGDRRIATVVKLMEHHAWPYAEAEKIVRDSILLTAAQLGQVYLAAEALQIEAV